MAAIDQLSGLMQALGALQGQETKQTQTTKGGTTTQQTQLSDAAVQEQIKRILAGPGGVRDIGGAARRSGLYDSTAEETLLGNLYATAAAQGELARAPTVTTQAPQTTVTKQETPGLGIGSVLGTVVGAAALNKALDIGGDVIGGGLDSLLGSFGIGSGSSGGTGTKGSKGFLEGLTSGDISGGLSVGDGDFGLSAAINEGPGINFSGDVFGSQMGLGLSGIEEGSVGTAGLGGARRSQTDGDFDLVGSVGNALSGFFGGGGLGGLVGAITSGFSSPSGGGGGGRSGGTVICTALMEQGELDEKLYAASAEYLKTLSPLVKVGYHSWGIRVATKIRKGSKITTRICRPVARSRTKLLASRGTVWDHIKYPLGTITKFVGEPACGALGWFLVTFALWADLQIPETQGV